MPRTETINNQKVALMREMLAGSAAMESAARRLMDLDPEFPFPYMALGTAAATAGDFDQAEPLLWRALSLAPCSFSNYLALADVLNRRDPESPVGMALILLAVWKLAVSDEVPEAAAEMFDTIRTEGLDLTDPETFELLATTSEISNRKLLETPAVQERLHPYFVLNDLQRQAPSVVSGDLIDEITADAAVYEPLLRAAIRESGTPMTSLTEPSLGLMVALLGEIGGPERIDELLSPALLNETVLFDHANWAVWRIGQRDPAGAFERLRGAIPEANLAMRCGLAEHLGMLPASPETSAALLSLLDGFSTFSRHSDAGHLLLTICFFLEERGEESRVESVLRTYLPLLSKRDCRNAQDSLDSGEFAPIILNHGLNELNIEDICLDRALMQEEDEDDEDEEFDEDEELDEFDEEPVTPRVAPVRPGRNDPCWCGSGKKYKKCHLAQDESGGAPAVAQAVSRPGTSLMQEVIDNVFKWQTPEDGRIAYRAYFDEDLDPDLKGMDKGKEAGFMQWLLYDFRAPSTGRTAVEEFRRRRGPQLRAADRAKVESWCNARYGLFEVQRVEEGRGVEVKDHFAGDAFFVHDISSSLSLVPRDILLARVESVGDRHEFAGNGVMVPRAQISSLVERIESEAGAAGQPPAEFIRANSHRLHREVDEIGKDSRGGLTVRTPEGDTVEFCAATFEVLDEAGLLEALRKVSGFEETPTKNAPPGAHHFAWLDPEGEGPRRSYGSFEIRAGKLRLECMSKRRLDLGRQALVARAGPYLKHLGDTFESVQAAMARHKTE